MKKTPAIIRIFVVAAIAVSMLTPVQAQTATAANAVVELDVNGMKVLIKRRPGTPTVAAGLFFRGGSRNLTAANAGIESFALTVAGEATKNFPRQKLRKEIARMGTNIVSGSNRDFSALSLACTKPNFETSWKIFVDVALNPTFAVEDVQRLRETRLTALRAVADSPESLLEDLNETAVYAGHPYANSPDGTVDTVAKFKAADLAAYHKSILETSRLLLVVVGDVEPQALQKEIEAAFGSLPRGSYKPEQAAPLVFAKGTLDITEKDIQTDYVKGTFAAPSLRDPDYYAMRTAITILQQNVFQEVRVRRNLSYAPDADLASMAANTGSISVSSVNPNEAVQAMLGEIQKLQRGEVDQESINQMSGFFLTTHYLKQETNAAQAGELAQYELNGGGWRNSLEFLDRIRKVKAADVQTVANKYMRNLRFTVVGDPKLVNGSYFKQN